MLMGDWLQPSLKVNESGLTGESESIIKDISEIKSDNIQSGIKEYELFSGSLVTYGRLMF